MSTASSGMKRQSDGIPMQSCSFKQDSPKKLESLEI
jgi:hypothetical protein